MLQMLFGTSPDVIYREMAVGPGMTRSLLVYIDGMIDRNVLQRVVEDFLDHMADRTAPPSPRDLSGWLARGRASVPGVRTETELPQAIAGLPDGDALLFLEGSTEVVRLAVPGWESRTIGEPETEKVVRGPRDGFVEPIHINLSLIRRRIRDERLRAETITLGTVTGTRVCLLYIHGLCKPALVREARSRLSRIKTDGIIDSAYIEEFIEDTPWTVFPTIKNTERPDVVAASLLEGRFAILTDGSPFALIAPALFVDMMQAPEDHYERFPVVTVLRALRWLFAFIALLGPAFYVALTTFHHEMVPTSLLMSIMGSREGVPFPALIEALGMEIAFEALREAGIRLPRQVGQAISIVGALVVGQAAVQAGIVSPLMIIVVALTGIASFIIPRYSAAVALRLLRFPMLLLAASFGAYGITLGVCIILTHLMGLRSFGVPYYAPLGPWLPTDHQDVIYRAPRWASRRRGRAYGPLDPVRTAPGLMPGFHQQGGSKS